MPDPAPIPDLSRVPIEAIVAQLPRVPAEAFADEFKRRGGRIGIGNVDDDVLIAEVVGRSEYGALACFYRDPATGAPRRKLRVHGDTNAVLGLLMRAAGKVWLDGVDGFSDPKEWE